MVQRKNRKTLFTVISVLIALVLIIGIVVFVRALSNNPAPVSNEPTQVNQPEVPAESESSDTSTDAVPEDTTNETAIDPQQVSTVGIEPMAISVSYMKGSGGFEYEVMRNPNGTQYVQFSAPALAGTRCTDDAGVFASIIENPTADEGATLTKKTTVDGTVYGLSLADESCTNDDALLKQYQDAFSAPFTLLKKM